MPDALIRDEVKMRAGGDHAAAGAAKWLALAAAPTFVLMALWTGLSAGHANMLCMGMADGSSFSGMTPMYVLMGVFHAGPWLKLILVR
jgi:hypothetical protein